MPSILIIDDEEVVRSTFRDVLETEHYEVTTVCDAAEAREHLSQKRYDVMLTDLLLPEENGLSLLRFATKLDNEVSVVMVTGHPDLTTAVEALKEGAYDFLTKPVARQSLLAVVERACERKHLVAEKKRLERENAEYQRSLELKVEERTHDLRESERRYKELFQETRRAYEELKEAQERLIRTERLAAIGELAARIAHEIRNPLGAISNSVGVLRRDLKVDGDDRRLLDVVSQESLRLGSIIADFLKYAKPRPIERTPQALTEIVDDLLLLLSKDARAVERISIERSYDDGLPPVEADAAQTREAVWNLLVNAVEAMPEGGTLGASVHLMRGLGPSSVEIEISDTGKGISPDDRENIFQPFHTTKADGTGLGLAIVHRIVDEHGGSVDFHSVAGQGSSFILRFPLTSDEQEHFEPKQEARYV